MGEEQRKTRLTVRTYVHRGDQLVCTDDLTEAEKESLGAWLEVTMLNEFHRGSMKFEWTGGRDLVG